MTFVNILDPLSIAFVLGGTLVATLLRCGWRDCGAAVQAIAHLFSRPFDSLRVRAELAVQIREIGERGLIRVEPHQVGDGEFDELSDALVRHRSIRSLYDEHERYRARRAALAGTARAVLAEAAELGPVLGLAGTLLSLGGLSALAVDGDYGSAIGMAVTTTFYGLISANFLYAPLAGAIGRRARAEEQARQDLLDWLTEAVERAAPAPRRSMQSKAAA
ncbi:MAG: MotA/TolQ/ExbB proton channel family protein [Altererythrobacter sp.]|nr:MotA/TolQ/ExbB proton channel family protein [Altererythrobacter sp.]